MANNELKWKDIPNKTKVWLIDWANVIVMTKLIVFMLMMAGGAYMYMEYEHHSGMWWTGAMTLYFGMGCATLYIIVWIFLIVGRFIVDRKTEPPKQTVTVTRGGESWDR